VTTVDVEDFVNMSIDAIGECGTLDAFLDKLAESIGHPLLMDINYEPVAVNEDKTIKIKVTGYVEVREDEGEDVRPEA
jgi:hypothetical protein